MVSLDDKSQRVVAGSSQGVVFSHLDHAERDSSPANLCNFQNPSPSRVRPSLPLVDVKILPEDEPDHMQTIENISIEVEPVKSIFEPLKRYITSCFRDCNCLNSSFQIPRTPSMRATSEKITSPTSFTNLVARADIGSLPFKPDAQMLLRGDSAESGTGWIGSGRVEPSSPSKVSKKLPERASSPRVTLNTPRTHWEELSEWYHVVLSAGCAWKGVLNKVEIMNSIGGIHKSYEISVEDQQLIEQDLAHARNQVQRTLLDASETLLRRPGFPINEPQACRFLLLLLANPIFTPSGFPSGYHSGSKPGAYAI